MKQNTWFFPALFSLTAAAVLAQDTTPAPSTNAAPVAAAPTIAAPPPATAPAAEPKPKRPARTVAIKSRTPLDPPATALVKGDSVNVRGQPSFNGEVLGHLKKGETVTVEEEITLSRPPKDEPANWSRILMPTNIPVWVDGQFIDADARTVKVRRVRLRGGPGENYSAIGILEKGTAVTELRHENGWLAIQAPTNAFAFVAAEFLDIQKPAVVAPPPSEVVNVPTPVAPTPAASEAPAVAPAPAAPQPAPVAPAPTAQSEAEQEMAALRQAEAAQPAPVPATPTAEAAAATPAPAPTPEPVTPRIVTREGYVHKAYNIQAPADFELHESKTDRLIDYLQQPAALNFNIYIGTHISVTGPEMIDQRWPRTPVLQVQSVSLIP
jgi:uncharacterized protein YgiM (DUF1202 family)